MTDGGPEERRSAIKTFLNDEGGLTLNIPKLADDIGWREPYLSGTQDLMVLYDQSFRRIDSHARNLLQDPVRKAKHIFHQPNRGGLEQLVIQLQQGSYRGPKEHLFVEFLAKIPRDPEPVNIFENVSQVMTIAQRLHSFIDKWFPENTEEPIATTIDDEPLPQTQVPIPLVTRLITVPPMDEGAISKEGSKQYLFHRDLADWWRHFFGTPTADSQKWLQSITPRSRHITSWMFHYDPSGTITTLEYMRQNAPHETYGRSEVKTPGIKLVSPNSAEFQKKHSQSLAINLQTGDITNHLEGVSVHGPLDQKTFEYSLVDGMLDQKDVRFNQPRWYFDDVVSEVIGDIPLDIKVLNETGMAGS